MKIIKTFHEVVISRFVVYHLQSHAKVLPSYVQDTIDFINKLETFEYNSKDSMLVILDVRALYTNILTHHVGIEAQKETNNNQTSESIATRVTIKFLYLILTLNIFILNGINYLRIKGCAMGTICAPAHTTIFIEKFEKTSLIPSYQKHLNILLQITVDLQTTFFLTERKRIGTN